MSGISAANNSVEFHMFHAPTDIPMYMESAFTNIAFAVGMMPLPTGRACLTCIRGIHIDYFDTYKLCLALNILSQAVETLGMKQIILTTVAVEFDASIGAFAYSRAFDPKVNAHNIALISAYKLVYVIQYLNDNTIVLYDNAHRAKFI